MDVICVLRGSRKTDRPFVSWSMRDRIKIQTFSFDQPFQSYQKEEFVLAFMQDPNVYQNLQVVSDSGRDVCLGIKATGVNAEQISCSVLSMSLFDKLQENNIVREKGQILKCLDDFYEDITISDELRKMLLLEDSDNYDLYGEAERSEFLFHLFRHVCLGGAVCQYEDKVTPYLDVTKMLYKDLVSVQKDSSSGSLHVTSIVFEISALADGAVFYPSDREHVQDFAYLVVDPLKRHVHVLYHKFGAVAFST